MKSTFTFLKFIKRSYKYRFYSSAGCNNFNEFSNELTSNLKHKIEEHWSLKLLNPTFNENDATKQKYYVLSMFPYPSGHLHMGHVRVYTISDTIARFQRMNNKNVIHPIGWDAFGLPAENAAIESGVAPAEWTEQNIKFMKTQLNQLGCSFEWHRELSTCDPEYYHWTQMLFLKLYDAGLAYQKEALVNWDPVDQTVLADEQVDENGCSWRSGARLERRPLKQWFIRTTRFAKQLLDNLDDPILQDWRDIIKIQKHWIGECNGVAFNFPLSNKDGFITVWTSTPEHIERANFIAITEANVLSNSEKETFNKLKVEAQNPFTGKNLPIFLTNENDFSKATDSHLGIGGISEQDATFCSKYSIDYETCSHLSEQETKARQKDICMKAEQLKIGGYWTSEKLKDWLISRQRYWGTPIPIIHCPSCGVVPVPKKQLPVTLPNLKGLSHKGSSQLSEYSDWLNTTCSKCGGPAKRETDTMDTFVDSSWYYLRYLDNKNTEEMFESKKIRSLTPVDLYIGGKEHATLHLYYARFVSHFLHSLGMIPEREPFKRLLVQGMVMGRSFRLKGTGKYVPQDEIKIVDAKKNKAIHIPSQEPVVMSWEKMSKSKRNGVDPDKMFKEYGIDTTRLLILADVAPTSHRNWNSTTFPGIINWQKRLWMTLEEFLKFRQDLPKMLEPEAFKKHNDYMFDSRNFYVKGVNFNYSQSQQLSVAISKMQGLTNSLRRVPSAIFAHSPQFERALACQLIALAPMAPHFASELWSGFVSAANRLNTSEEINWNKTVLEQKWPDVDCDYNLDLVCQVNGVEMENSIIKIPRCEIEKLSKDEAVELVLQQKEVQEALCDRTIDDCCYTMYEAYEGVVKIVARKAPKQVVQS